jgi:Family of unknown function (DUF5317)
VAGVWVLAIAVAIAVVIVLATRGSPRNLTLAFRSWWMLGLAAAILIALAVVDLPRGRLDTLGFGALMLAYVLVLAFCLLNLRIRGMGVVAIGVVMNALVIGLNQGMPRDADAGAGQTAFHRPERDTDLLPVLGEIVPLPDPIGGLVSFGDIVIGVGLVDVAYHASRPVRRRRATRSSTGRAAGRTTRRAPAPAR